ncbi:carbon catabolite repressor protein 4 homolog 6 [Ipomoea triloba]|uniref:carbon catabolite repressor protein 4 homolog 6 n=1 Tax=Ipomoea triloba TaxID=35885 RepID=UPI00125DBBE9|nr:carbon catabolite repressor protein 4 homolog 6 [Ipomoea triloba]
MKRSPPSFHRIAAATSSDGVTATATPSDAVASRTAMYNHKHLGGRRGRGRRSYSDQPSGGGRGEQQVSGDSHFRSVQDTNRGFRPSYSRGGKFSNFRSHSPRPPPPSFSHHPPYYSAHPPPPNLYSNQQFHRPRPPSFYNQQLNRPGWPHFDQNQQFRPPRPPPEFRPRPQPPKALNFRVWEHAKPEPPPHYDRFTVLSYNILADCHATDHWRRLYFHIPRHILDWEWRKRSIIFELGLWSADILCLQEVDRFKDLEAELQLRGYSGIWKMRTGVAVDGCAIFWRGSRFKLLHEDSIEFKNHGLRDNVAQICVFEFLDQCNGDASAASSTSSSNTNKVVICNIHVLFNPRRGEMKLGQIRLLLDRADYFSKLWDGAPIVICGDFNSTPKSPLYNFIAEQKLNILEVPRDKVSGQESATLNLLKPSPPVNRAQSSADSVKDSLVSQEGEGRESSSTPNVRTWSPEIESVDGLSRGIRSQNQNSVVNDSSESFVSVHFEDKSREGTVENFHDSQRYLSAPLSVSKDSSPVSPNEDIISPTKEKDSSNPTESRHDEYSTTTNAISSPSSNYLDSEMHSGLESICNKEDVLVGENHPRKETSSVSTSPVDAFSSEVLSDPFSPNSHVISSLSSPRDVSLLSNGNVEGCAPSPHEFNYTSEQTAALLDKKMDNLSLDNVFEEAEDQSIGEDSEAFLSELCGATDPFPSESTQLQVYESEKLDEQSQGSALGKEILCDDLDADSPAVYTEKFTYDPSAWTPIEIQTATGSVDCTVMEHRLKLRSVYREVEEVTGTRDSTGEPEVTSYHSCFLGTVDYIWRSEGLQTVRVLAPIPKQAMQWVQGFPTKKWGSDHIALVSELAFTKDIPVKDIDVE